MKELVQLTFWPEEPLANRSALPANAKASMTNAEELCFPILESLNVSGLNGLSGKTSPVFCHQTADGILEPSSGRWGNWGMNVPSGFLTLNGSELPNPAAVCLLSDILETEDIPERFYLSRKACAGIIRRAKRRGKILPTELQQALEQILN